MLAADTNVLVRFLMNDDASQSARAKAFLSHENVWVSKTVLLETAWVLLSVYRVPAQDVNHILKRTLGLPNIHVEDAVQVARAFEWTASGIEFADALHLASVANAHSFLTFDRQLVARASKLKGVRVAAL
jgi:predicted nucleic-acid-binding protein